MENIDRQQRQRDPQGYSAAQQHRLLHQQATPSYSSATLPSHFRPLALQQSPKPNSPDRRGSDQAFGAYGYGGGPQLVASGLHYHQPEYAAAPTRAQQLPPQPQTPQYGHYAPSMMYNMAAAAAAAATAQQPQQTAPSPSTSFESVPQYQQPPARSPATLDVLSSQFSVPPQQYYNSQQAMDAVPTNGPAVPMVTQSTPAPYNSAVPFSPQHPISISRDSTYGSGMETGVVQDSSTAEHDGRAGEYAEEGAEADLDAAFERYRTELRRTNEWARDGKLAEAAIALLSISQWLIGNAEGLGLTHDDENDHAGRLRLWADFNHCWLAVLQRQTDMVTEAGRVGRGPRAPQSLIDGESLLNLGNELVKLCDVIEKHGLVDYEMGVWEESIIDSLVRCIEALGEPGEADGGGGGGGAGGDKKGSLNDLWT